MDARPSFIFVGSFTVWLFHWLLPLSKTIQHNRRLLGYDFLCTGISVAVVGTMTGNYNQPGDECSSCNAAILSLTCVSAAIFLGELVWLVLRRNVEDVE